MEAFLELWPSRGEAVALASYARVTVTNAWCEAGGASASASAATFASAIKPGGGSASEAKPAAAPSHAPRAWFNQAMTLLVGALQKGQDATPVSLVKEVSCPCPTLLLGLA